ncbi:MAG: ABC transporter permease [Fervidobacterium sp.]
MIKIKKEFNDLKVRFFGILIVIFILFFLLAPLQRFTISFLEGYSSSPQIEKFLPSNMLSKLKEWNFYINSQWYGKNYGQIIPIISIIMAFPLFAREFENNTIAFLLVRKNRREVFFSKFTAGFVALSIVLLTAGFLPLIYSFLLSKDYNYAIGMKFAFQSYFSGLFWYGVGVLFSLMFNDQVRPLLAGFGTIAITTVAGILRPLKFMNTYNYALGVKIFETGNIDISYTIGVIIITILIIIISHNIFLRKEV